jgi:hypothetical protein
MYLVLNKAKGKKDGSGSVIATKQMGKPPCSGDFDGTQKMV